MQRLPFPRLAMGLAFVLAQALAHAASPETCEVVHGAPPAAPPSLLARNGTAVAHGPDAVETDIDRALGEPAAAGLHAGVRKRTAAADGVQPPSDTPPSHAAVASKVPLIVGLYLRVPGSAVRVCGPIGAPAGDMRYFPVAPLWHAPSGLCHFSLQADEDRHFLAAAGRDIGEADAWKHVLFAAAAERCDDVELARYVETVGVSDHDLAAFFARWPSFVSAPGQFEAALRRVEREAPRDAWRPPAEIALLAQARPQLRIVSIVNRRDGDGMLDRLAELAGPRLTVRFARWQGNDPWVDVRLAWGALDVTGFGATTD